MDLFDGKVETFIDDVESLSISKEITENEEQLIRNLNTKLSILKGEITNDLSYPLALNKVIKFQKTIYKDALANKDKQAVGDSLVNTLTFELVNMYYLYFLGIIAGFKVKLRIAELKE